MKEPYLDPIDYFAGRVSVLAIMKNLENGYTAFPKYMGEVKGNGGVIECDACKCLFRIGERTGNVCDDCKP